MQFVANAENNYYLLYILNILIEFFHHLRHVQIGRTGQTLPLSYQDLGKKNALKN